MAGYLVRKRIKNHIQFYHAGNITLASWVDPFLKIQIQDQAWLNILKPTNRLNHAYYSGSPKLVIGNSKTPTSCGVCVSSKDSLFVLKGLCQEMTDVMQPEALFDTYYYLEDNLNSVNIQYRLRIVL